MTDDYSREERLSIKLESGIPESKVIEQYKQELVDYLECCLTSLLNDTRTREERRAYIERQARLKGVKFAERLKARFAEEWERRKK